MLYEVQGGKKMKVLEFIEEVDQNGFDMDIRKIDYLSYDNKIELCRKVFYESMFVNKRYRPNTPYFNLLYLTTLINTYTIIDIDDVWKDYDVLAAKGLIDLILNEIRVDEREQLDSILEWVVSDYKENRRKEK